MSYWLGHFYVLNRGHGYKKKPRVLIVIKLLANFRLFLTFLALYINGL